MDKKCNHNEIRPDKCFCPDSCECKQVGIGMCYDIMKIYQPIITQEQKVFKQIAKNIKEVLLMLKNNDYYEEYIVKDGMEKNGWDKEYYNGSLVYSKLLSKEILDSLEKDAEYLLRKAGR